MRGGMVYNRAWLGQLEGEPVTSLATLATGVYPRRDHVAGPQWQSGPRGSTVDLTSLPQVDSGIADRVLLHSEVPSLAGALKAVNPLLRVLAVSGSDCAEAESAAGWLGDYTLCAIPSGGSWVPHSVPGHALPPGLRASIPPQPRSSGSGPVARAEGWQLGTEDRWVAQAAVHSMRAIRPHLTYVIFPELAEVQRYAPPGQRASLLRRALRGIDLDIGMVLGEIGREGVADRTDIAVVGSGGIEPAVPLIARTILSHIILAGGGEELYVTGDAGVYIGLRDPLQAQPVAQAIAQQRSWPLAAVYYRSAGGHYIQQFLARGLPRSYAHALASLLATIATRMSPDVVVVYRTGALTPLTAAPPQHGGGDGLDWSSQRIPLILAGPGIPAGRVSAYPARLVDVAPTLAVLLNLPLSGTDGTVLPGIRSRHLGPVPNGRELLRWQRALARISRP